MVGPETQLPGRLETGGGGYSAVWPVAPITKSRPSFSSTEAPISEMLSTSGWGVAPASTQRSAAMMYFSALGGLEQSTAWMVPSASSDQLSPPTLLSLLAAAVQVLVEGS